MKANKKLTGLLPKETQEKGYEILENLKAGSKFVFPRIGEIDLEQLSPARAEDLVKQEVRWIRKKVATTKADKK